MGKQISDRVAWSSKRKFNQQQKHPYFGTWNLYKGIIAIFVSNIQDVAGAVLQTALTS